MLASLVLQIRSLFKYHKRYMLSQIVSYTVISFIIISSVRIAWLYAEIANFEYTNIYKIDIKDDIDIKSLDEAIGSFIESSDSRDIVQAFAPNKDNGCVVMGTNGIADAFWVWDHLDSSLIRDDKAYAWMGSGFWQNDTGYKFPYDQITINDENYKVAGVVDMQMYCDREDVQMYSEYGVYLPLKRYIDSEFPIDYIALRLYNAPDEARHTLICELFSQFSDDDILPLPKVRLAGFGTLIALICIPMVLVCAILLGRQMHDYCMQRRSLIWVESAMGATAARVFSELFIQIVLLSLIGWAISLYPSDIVYCYANYDRIFPKSGWAFTSIIYFVVIWLTHGVAIRRVICATLERVSKIP